MRLAVLGSTESWYLKDLRRAAADEDEIFPLSFRRLLGKVGGGRFQASSGDVGLREADCLLVRTMPPGSLEQVVFRMDVLASLEAAGMPVVNPPKALETSVDKFLALAKLDAAGIPIPRTIVCQTVDEASVAFEELGGDVVLKPLFGSEGRGLMRLDDEGLARRACQMLSQLGAVLYLQEFIPHPGHDYRALVLGDRVLGMRRVNPSDWRTNISRGARAEACELTDEHRELALRAAATVGGSFLGVDLLRADSGETYILEVNAVPGWKALAAAHQIDVAALLLEHLRNVVA
ncbi:MAG: RimK family alpha-L-glutamate ligase [Planctomycetales bacterium]